MYQCDFLVGVDDNTIQYYESPLRELGCNIYKGGYIIGSSGKKVFLAKERELLRKNKYDIVHSHMDFMNASVLKTAKEENVPGRISHVHTTFPDKANWSALHKLKYKIQQFALREYSTDLLGCSRNACIDYYGTTKKAEVLYNAFDIKTFLDISREKDRFKVVTVGRICEPKNPSFIIEVMDELLKLDSRYELFWVGDGNLKNKAEQLAAEKGINQQIHFIGATTKIRPYLEQCDIALFPSKSEGLGIALVEAQLAGCFTFYSSVIPKEADIGYGVPLELNAGAKFWAKQIDDAQKSELASNYKLDMNLVSHYDLNTMLARIEEIYQGYH